MALIDLGKREIHCKIVYYGPGRCGKTTNLIYIHHAMIPKARGKMVTIDTKGDRTLFFDLLPLHLGSVHDFDIRIQLYTVPGQIMYEATRKLVLKGVDGIVFVADPLQVRRQRNKDSLAGLSNNLAELGVKLTEIPIVLQYNKRDLTESEIPTLSVTELSTDLNSELQAPEFTATATLGEGVFESLRAISKLTVHQVAKKNRLLD